MIPKQLTFDDAIPDWSKTSKEIIINKGRLRRFIEDIMMRMEEMEHKECQIR